MFPPAKQQCSCACVCCLDQRCVRVQSYNLATHSHFRSKRYHAEQSGLRMSEGVGRDDNYTPTKVVCDKTRAVIPTKAGIHAVYFRKPICSEYTRSSSPRRVGVFDKER